MSGLTLDSAYGKSVEELVASGTGLALARELGFFRDCSGLRFTMTGTLTIKRAAMKGLLTALGAQVSETVGTAPNALLIVGEGGTGTGKWVNAGQRSVPRITEEQLIELILAEPDELIDGSPVPAVRRLENLFRAGRLEFGSPF